MEALVPNPLGADPLSTTRHVVLILRLVLAPGQQQLKGHVMDPETGWCLRFAGTGGLAAAVDRWVALARRGPGDDRQQDPPA
jgi:hypothetical protein